MSHMLYVTQCPECKLISSLSPVELKTSHSFTLCDSCSTTEPNELEEETIKVKFPTNFNLPETAIEADPKKQLERSVIMILRTLRPNAEENGEIAEDFIRAQIIKVVESALNQVNVKPTKKSNDPSFIIQAIEQFESICVKEVELKKKRVLTILKNN